MGDDEVIADGECETRFFVPASLCILESACMTFCSEICNTSGARWLMSTLDAMGDVAIALMLKPLEESASIARKSRQCRDRPKRAESTS